MDRFWRAPALLAPSGNDTVAPERLAVSALAQCRLSSSIASLRICRGWSSHLFLIRFLVQRLYLFPPTVRLRLFLIFPTGDLAFQNSQASLQCCGSPFSAPAVYNTFSWLHNTIIASMSKAAQENGFNLSDFRVPGPPEAYYIPDFLTDEEEQYLLRKVRTLQFK
jgi:hypothetical protein